MIVEAAGRAAGQIRIATAWSDTFDVVLKSTQDINVNPDDPTELNNSNYKARPITILLRPPPDLVVTEVTPQATAVGGDSFSVSWTVQNQGTQATEDLTLFDDVYLSDVPTFVPPGGGNDVGNQWFLGKVQHNGIVLPNETYTAQATFHLSPEITGRYVFVETNTGGRVSAVADVLGFQLDVGRRVPPTWEGPFTDNNVGMGATHVTALAPADLVVTSVTATEPNYSGELTTVTWTVQNQGADTWSGTRYWEDFLYLSRYPTFEFGRVKLIDRYAHSNDVPLAAGESYSQSATFALPQGIGGTESEPQTWYAYVRTDPGGHLSTLSRDNTGSRNSYVSTGYEDPDNNRGRGTIPVIYREPDLRVTELVVPATPPLSGDTAQVSWTVTNVGNRATRGAFWSDRVFLSHDSSLDGEDTQLASVRRLTTLPAGEAYATTLDVRLPDGIGGDFYLLVFTDANVGGIPGVPGLTSPNDMGVVQEFQGEGNNVTAAFMPVVAVPPPDLQVTAVSLEVPDPALPGHVLSGQSFTVAYTVTNNGSGATPDRQGEWEDRIYLSRDQFLSGADVFFDFEFHSGGLDAGESYQRTVSIKAPRTLTGPWYVFVVTDQPKPREERGEVFEGSNENNNARSTDTPLLIELPPPSDLVIDSILMPGSAMSGDTVHVTWTVDNIGVNPAMGAWSDTVYLSRDNIWDIGDRPIGRYNFSGTVEPGASYTGSLTADLPPAAPGTYRIIVRTDVFDEIYESQEANNTTSSIDALQVSVTELHLGVPLDTTLDTGEDRLYQVEVGQGQTLRVDLTSPSSDAANVLFLRYNALPSGSQYDAAYQGALQANQFAVIPSTTAGTYFVLIRGVSQPAADTPVRIVARTLPFGITDIVPDKAGDSRYVTTTILGAQFDPQAIVKISRPGIAEYEPVSYRVMDRTRIIAIFDLREAPHGLYDVKVINPNGETALAPYRYLVEQAMEPDVSIALGGPRVVWAGESGLYGFTLASRTNVDIPYVEFQYGVPTLPLNGTSPYVGLTGNVSGTPNVDGVPWASIAPSANIDGKFLTTGYAIDFADRSHTTFGFIVQTYPNGLPGGAYTEQPGQTAFEFNIMGAATALTPDEFVARQSELAATLRTRILEDPSASPSLKTLAADASSWTGLYLEALTQAGLLRPVDTPPQVRDNPLLVGLQATLAAGILAGPAGEEIITDGDLVAFFDQVREWYGDDPSAITPHQSTDRDLTSPVLGEPSTYSIFSSPPASEFDLALSAPTHYEGFAVYVPWGNYWDPWNHPLGVPLHLNQPQNANFLNVHAPDFSEFFTGVGESGQAVINGPLAHGPEQFVPAIERQPYTIQFANGGNAAAAVGEIRVVSQLDPNLDARSFRLGDLQLGDIQVSIPTAVGSFQDEFDFTQSKGFVLRVSAGIDINSNTMTWLLQAIDPLTGEVSKDPAKGLLPPDDEQGAGRGFVSYTVAPREGLATGTRIAADARVLFDTTAPLDTDSISYTIDGVAPTTTLTSTPVAEGGSDYEVRWSTQDDGGGSGVKSVTVFVAEDGGDYRIWLNQTADTSGVYNGTPGHTYQFLALATDNAGNQELPPVGVEVPSDGSRVNLGGLPSVEQTPEDIEPAPPPIGPQPDTNPLFVQAADGIPSFLSPSHLPEFQSVIAPFTGQVFATGLGQSDPRIGPMALLVEPDGSVLASGGEARNELFRFGVAGGVAGAPLATLAHPIYDMVLDASGTIIWAATGGGPLLKLDAESGAILDEFGDSLTQSLAIEPDTGLIYLSSGNGIEVFDPATSRFSHFSDIRVGSLAFADDGTLWAATWPRNQAQIIRFRGTPVKPELMLTLDAAIESIAFGPAGSELEGLLFVSHSGEAEPGAGSNLTLVDLVQLQSLALATGGTRGMDIKAGADGRVFLSQSHQIDVLNPVRPPNVVATNPPEDAVVIVPFGSMTVTFDDDMLVGEASDPHSVLNAANYELRGDSAGIVPIIGIVYEQVNRTAVLSFDPLYADRYQLEVQTGLQSMAGLHLAEGYVTHFTAISNLDSVLSLQFTHARSDRSDGTISYDVTVTNTGPRRLLLPVILQLTPSQRFDGEPLGTQGRTADGSWLIDLSNDLPADGILGPGQSSSGRTITVLTPNRRPVNFAASASGLPGDNNAPQFTSLPPAVAAANEVYQYQATAIDPDDDSLRFVLASAPAGMTVDAVTGLLTWTPTIASPALLTVALQVYDVVGAYDMQTFTLNVDGVNRAPFWSGLDAPIQGREGEELRLVVGAHDTDGDELLYWADRLPHGAIFDPVQQALLWTPDFRSAGTYPGVRIIASDGLHQVGQTVTFVIEQTPQAPIVPRPADLTAREGDAIRMQLQASDVDGLPLTYFSDTLPPGAFLDPASGLFEWTPDFTQQGVYQIPFSVSNGSLLTAQTARIAVLNVNGDPVIQGLGSFDTLEGQQLQFRGQAFDPDHPDYIAPDRDSDGVLYGEDADRATVLYSVSGLPPGAIFDLDTLIFTWTPGFDAAGIHLVTITATDDGDQTGNPSSTSETVAITVRNANRAPQIAFIENRVMDHDTVLSVPVTVVDPDGNPMQLTQIGMPAFGQFVDHGDGSGEFVFSPQRDDRGDYTVSIIATDDGDGGGAAAVLSGTQSFVITVNAQNVPPHIAPIGNKVAVVGTPFHLSIASSDGDLEPLTFNAVGLPAGASLSPGSAYGQAILDWTPTLDDIGKYAILVTVEDGGNGDPSQALSDEQAFTLDVRTSNQEPVWVSAEDQSVGERQTLTAQFTAVDADGDGLSYLANNLPVGAQLDPFTGILTWTPGLIQTGTFDDIVITATDGSLSVTREIAITVTPENEAPLFVPLLAQSGREGTQMQFVLVATDPDQDELTFGATSGLPAGAVLDTVTGRFEWTPGFEQAGDYSIEFTATDPLGLTADLVVEVVIDNVNRAPTLQVTNHSIQLGEPFSLQLIGSDPDAGTTLTYSADDMPEGATLDAQTGLFEWTPGPAQAGDFAVQFKVTDGNVDVYKPAVLRSSLDPAAPQVIIELTPSFPQVPGAAVLVHVAASGFAPIAALTLEVDGQALALDGQGRTTFIPPSPGLYAVDATASDIDGRIGSAGSVIKVRDPNDLDAPVVSFQNVSTGSVLAAATDLQGTVSDSNLDSWSLDRSLLGSDVFETLAAGRTSVDGDLYHFDPSTLTNGFYRLRLTATDVSGRTSQVEVVVEASTPDKPSAYQEMASDLSLALGGIVLDLTRAYDSLERNRSGTFGYGWRLVNRDSDVQTNVAPTGQESRGVYRPFQIDTRLYLTLPDGRRVGYTFTPQKHEHPGITYYTPAYTADPGVDYLLGSADAVLGRGPNGFFDLAVARPFNPASGQFDGPDYTVTAPDGTVYHLGAEDGVTEQVLTNGNRLYFSDNGITSSIGEAAQFVRNAAGNVATLIGPDGTRVEYDYDSAGNLTSAHNVFTNETRRYGYAATHLLVISTAPAPESGNAVRYGATPQVTSLAANLGGPGQLTGELHLGTLAAGEAHDLAFALRSSEILSTPDDQVFIGVEVAAEAGSSLQPAAPSIEGLAPLVERSGSGSAFALFVISREGLNLLRIAGADAATAGAYALRLYVAGDADLNGDVDGLDAQLVSQVLGTSFGEPEYLVSADADFDGTIDTADLQLLAGDFGFKANRAPAIQDGDALTHVDLPVGIDLAVLGFDPEGDEVFFRIFDASGGIATLDPGGTSVTFLPNPGYAGPASFQVLADDGFATSAPATIDVQVSDAPLINLDFVVRQPRLNLIYDDLIQFGDEFDEDLPAVELSGKPVDFAMSVVGDFADQAGVALPSSYLTFHSTDPGVASVSAQGVLHATTEGTTILTVSSRGVQAATAVTVGVPADVLGQQLYALGLSANPNAVTLSSAGGTKQFAIFPEADFTLTTDLSTADSGTRYFVNRPDVISVTGDGLATALAEGDVTVTIINGPAEAVVPARVEPLPTEGPAMLGAEGGIVTASDGSMVAVAPGGLGADTMVSLEPKTSADLPMAVPDGFNYAAAFEMDIGADPLTVPAQLAIKVDPAIAPGTTVYFFQYGDYLNDDGTTQPIWWQVESGIVGTDGMARTSSPPYPGPTGSSLYLVSSGDSNLARLAIQARRVQELLVTIALAESQGSLMGAIAYSARTGILASIAAPPMPLPTAVRVQAIPLEGLPVTSELMVQVDAGAAATYTTEITPPPTLPSDAPRITEVSVSLDVPDQPRLILTGQRFTPSGPGGIVLVEFDVGRVAPVSVTPMTASDTMLVVDVPNTVTLGIADITVIRADQVPTLVNGTVQNVLNIVESNVARIESNGTYVFVALPEAHYHHNGTDITGVEGHLAVLDGDPDGTLGDLIARIRLGSTKPDDNTITPQDFPFPRDVALTPDNSRAYVTLRGSGRVAVVDTVALRQVDVSGGEAPLFVSVGPIPAPTGVAVDPSLYDLTLTKPIDIRGTVMLPATHDLQSWSLTLVSNASGAEASLKSGQTSEVDSDVLAQLNPADYPPGFYRLRLVAVGKIGANFQTFVDQSVYFYLTGGTPSKEIRLPFGARPYGIAMGPGGKYAYVAVQSRYIVKGTSSSYVFQIDIDPDSPTYNQVVRHIRLGSTDPDVAPHGLRHLVVTPDGKKLAVTAPNQDLDPTASQSWRKRRGQLIEIDLSALGPLGGSFAPIIDDPTAIRVVTAGRGTYGVANIPIPGRNDVAFTNSESGDGVYVRYSASGLSRIIPLDLHSFANRRTPQLAVHNAHGIVFTPDGSYAIVAGRGDQVTSTIGGGFNGEGIDAVGITGFIDQFNNPLFEAGNIGIIKDPLGANPKLVAATRPVPKGYPVDLEITADGRYLYVSYQGLPVQVREETRDDQGNIIDSGFDNGAVFIYDLRAMLQQVEVELQNDPDGRLSKFAINDRPRNDAGDRVPNAMIDVRANYHADYSNLDTLVFSSNSDPARGPVPTGGFPGGIAVQTPLFEFEVVDASGDSTPKTVFRQGALRVTYDVPDQVVIKATVFAFLNGADPAITLKTYAGSSSETNDLLNLALSSPLDPGEYTVRVEALLDNGATLQSRPRTMTVLDNFTRRGDFSGEVFDYKMYPNTGVVIYGGGGTDTLDLGLPKAAVRQVDGEINVLATTPNTPPRQAVYHGTAFDYLELDDGREIYFQGIEHLKFSDGTKALLDAPDDPFYSKQWNLHVTDVPDAWRFSTGSSDVLIVSIDSGLQNPPVIPDDIDRTRWITNSTSLVMPPSNHGHNSISIMTSPANNTFGVSGINWTSRFMVQNVVNPPSLGVLQAIQQGLAFAQTNNLRAVFQASIENEQPAAVINAIRNAIQGTNDFALYSFAAGNHNRDIDNPSGSLGGYARLIGVQDNGLAIGALISGPTTAFTTNSSSFQVAAGFNNAKDVARAEYSNYGPKFTLMGPTDSPAVNGSGVVGTSPTGPGALYYNGTSAATPNVAGIASLVWSVNANLSGDEIKQLLIDTALPLESKKATTLTTSLSTAVASATSTQIDLGLTYFGGAGPFIPSNPTTIKVGTEEMLVWSINPGPTSSRYTVVRGYNGTTATTHSAGAGATLTEHNGSTPKAATTPGSTHDVSFGFGLINAGAALRRAYALTQKPELANHYLNNGLINPATPETGSSSAPGAGVQVLTLADLETSGTNADAALAIWSQRLEDATGIEIAVDVRDLAGDKLAEARIDAVGADGLPVAGTIVLDDDAAGVGWYIDATPFDHGEFATMLDDYAFRAADSEAADKYDLLTVLLHEAGHLLGFDPAVPSFAVRVGTVAGSPIFVGPGITAELSGDREHLDSGRYANDLLNDTLAPSERRLPSALNVAILGLVRGIEIGSLAVASSLVTQATGEAVITVNQDIGNHASAHQTSLLLDAATNPDLTNGDFSVGDPADPGFGWTASGSVAIENGAAVLTEDSQITTGLAQSFIIPDGATALQFTITDMDFAANAAGHPADAFEVALLDASTDAPLTGTVIGLTQTDSLLNVQATGEVFFASGVVVSGRTASGDSGSLDSPMTVTLDLTGVQAGTAVTLYFDLLGFASPESVIVIDHVALFGDAIVPPLTFSLDPASDSGILGDDLTNFAAVTLIGSTAPDLEVFIDYNNDDTFDATATADGAGNFTFTNVPLIEGPNPIVMAATNDAGTTRTSGTITLDTTITVDKPDLIPDDDSGQSDSDDVTNLSAPTFIVTAEPDAVVTLHVDNAEVGQVAAVNGTATFTLGELDDGEYAIRATARDAADNLIESDVLLVTIDTEPPQVMLDLADSSDTGVPDDMTTTLAVVTLVGDTEPLTPVELLDADQNLLGEMTSDDAGRFSFEGIALELGDNVFTARATDVAGNEGQFEKTITREIVVTIGTPDLVAADDSGQSDSDDITNVDTPTFTVAADSGTVVTLLIDDVEVGQATAVGDEATFTVIDELDDGEHAIRATARDAANGLIESDVLLVTLDTVPPPVTLDLAENSDTGVPDDMITTLAVVTLVGDTEPLTPVELLHADQNLLGATTSDDAGRFTFVDVALEPGDNVFTARATDVAGNEGQFETTITLEIVVTIGTPDLVAADDSGQSDSDDITNVNTPTFMVAADSGTVVTLLIDDVEVGQATAVEDVATFTVVDELGDGEHAIRATARDAADNLIESDLLLVTIDTVPPVVVPDETTTDEGMAVVVDVLTNDSEGPQPSSVMLAGQPSRGTATVIADEPDQGKIRYTPHDDFAGNDSFFYTVADIAGNVSASARVDVLIRAMPEEPVVWIDGSWTDGFRAALDADHQLGFEMPIDTADGGPILPWINIDRIHVVFDRDVPVEYGDLAIYGVVQPQYAFKPDDPTDTAEDDGFHYDPQTFTATWTLDHAVGLDQAGDSNGGERMLLVLAGARPDGSDHQARFSVLPGDANRDGRVNVLDTVAVRNRSFQSVDDELYSVFHDLDGSGNTNVMDTLNARNRAFTSLPEGETQVLPGTAPTWATSASFALSSDPEPADARRPSSETELLRTLAAFRLQPEARISRIKSHDNRRLASDHHWLPQTDEQSPTDLMTRFTVAQPSPGLIAES